MTDDPNSNTARDDMLTTRLSQIEKKIEAISPINNFYEGSKKFNAVDEFDLKELFRIIWAGKIQIILITAVFAILSVSYALIQPNMYRATVILVSSKDDQTSNLGNLSGKFGDLASLGGINLQLGSVDKSMIALKKVRTWNFIEEFITKNHIQKEVFAVNGWDISTGKLKIDKNIYDNSKQEWVEIYNPAQGSKKGPSSWMLYDKFNEFFSVSKDDATGFISFSIEYYSPIIATEWVTKLVAQINNNERNLAIKATQENIKFIESNIRQTENFEIRNMFYRLLEEQTKKLMLSSASKEYVFKVVDQAKVPEEKSSPKRALICIFGTLLGGFLGILIVLVRFFMTEPKKKT
ncbi:MAG: Wzz/FepE/Etk N-terminal domain-containing protein [Emcibacter sp.]|nr:Wzz/FepE/Etk N-terminal domain-containing protein [Emcibacter sp.]